MSSGFARSLLLRVGLALGGSFLLSGCDQWALRINSDGLLSINIVNDGGHARGRFRVRASQDGGLVRMLDLPASGQLRLDGFSEGALELMLLAPAGCEVSGPNPLEVEVQSGNTLNVAFSVRCDTSG
jgi:hypothetical protein